MLRPFFALATVLFIILSVNAFAVDFVQNSAVLTTTKTLPAIVAGADLDSAMVEIAMTQVGISGSPESTGIFEAYVESYAIDAKVEIVCKMKPIAWLGRTMDPTQKEVVFGLESTMANYGTGGVIAGRFSASRLIQFKIPTGVGGAQYKLLCRRNNSNYPATITYAHLKASQAVK